MKTFNYKGVECTKYPKSDKFNDLYETINPYDASKPRCDDAVVSFQNFLIESDEYTPPEVGSDTFEDDTVKLIKKAYSDSIQQMINDGIVNRVVYSGNKSLHCRITSGHLITNKEDYNLWFMFLCNYLEHHYNIRPDRSCSNPSRLTRKPNVYRPDRQVNQLCLYESKKLCMLDFSDDIKHYKEKINKDNNIRKNLFQIKTNISTDFTPEQKQKALQTNKNNVDNFINTVASLQKGTRHEYIKTHIGPILPQMKSLYNAGLFDWDRDFVEFIGFKDKFNHYKKIITM